MPLILFVCDLQIKKVKHKEEKSCLKLVPVTSGSEQAQNQPCSPEKADTSGERSKETSGKRKLFGNNSSGFPGHVQVHALGVGDGSWTGLGPGWAEELTQLQLKHQNWLPGNFLVVQWLGLGAFTAGTQVQSLVRELRSHKLHGTANT